MSRSIRDKRGTLTHLIDPATREQLLCNGRTAGCFSTRDPRQVTCPKCQKKIANLPEANTP